MRKYWIGLAALAVAIAPVAATAQTPTGGEMAKMMRDLGSRGLKGKKLDKAIEKASAYPLGSLENPVRASSPLGQRAYLDRLRCADGKAPIHSRNGNVGTGVYGYIIDKYSVRCGEAEAVDIYLDMYHDYVEPQAVPGFTIVPEGGGAITA